MDTDKVLHLSSIAVSQTGYREYIQHKYLPPTPIPNHMLILLRIHIGKHIRIPKLGLPQPSRDSLRRKQEPKRTQARVDGLPVRVGWSNARPHGGMDTICPDHQVGFMDRAIGEIYPACWCVDVAN